jgi:thiol:disulfide interchange protein
MPRILRLLPLLGALALTLPSFAQSFDAAPGMAVTAPEADAPAIANVAVTLLANRASIAPGETFLIGLTLEHPEHWHTYWKNPGDAGSLTAIAWKETSGATLGAWRYPAPHLYSVADIHNFVHEGHAVILIPVTVPASLKPGDTFRLKGTADWLECDDSSCNPKSVAISLDIPVKAAGEPANAGVFRDAENAIPENAPAGAVSLVNGDKGTVKLTVAAGALTGRDAASAKFFPASEKLPASFVTVKPVIETDGSLSFTFPDADKVTALKKLVGVITFAKGRAIEVSAEFSTAKAAAAIAVAPTAGATESSYGLPALLALAFGGGMLLNIMPCVFPVLGLKIYGFVNKAHSDRKKVVAHALAFAAGIVVSFWILAGAIIALKSGAVTLFGASGANIGWGFLLQIPGFVAGIAVLFLVMGLSLAGLFEFGTGVQNAAGSVEDKGGYAGSFLSGVLATLVATPCSGPGIAPAIGAAFAAPPVEAFAIFTAMALGLALPFVALASSPKLMKLLPRPGPWMESFKQAMAFLLFGTLAYFVWILGAQVEGINFLFILFALVGIAVACWVYGRWASLERTTQVRRTAMVVAGVFFVGSCVAIERSLPERATETTATEKSAHIEWAEWTPEAQAKHLAAGDTVYIDFTARWCATCQVNKRVFKDEAVIKAFAEKKVVTLKADWTNRNTTIGAELAKYNRAAIPFNVILKTGAETKPLPEILTADAVLEALK